MADPAHYMSWMVSRYTSLECSEEMNIHCVNWTEEKKTSRNKTAHMGTPESRQSIVTDLFSKVNYSFNFDPSCVILTAGQAALPNL